MRSQKLVLALVAIIASAALAGCASVAVDVTTKTDTAEDETVSETKDGTDPVGQAGDDQQKADEVAALIDSIYVQEWNDETDILCNVCGRQSV